MKTYEVAVRKDFPLASGESIWSATKKLCDGARKFLLAKMNLTEKAGGCYLVEAFSTAAVFAVYKYESGDDGKTRYWAVSFKRDDDGSFDFGSTQEVERVTSFQPKPSSSPTLKTLDGWKPFWNGAL